MMRSWAITFIACLALWSSVAVTWAGPPYLTDDPEPVPFHHWELYTFVTGDRTRTTNSLVGPALELNNGFAPNTQLHLIFPQAYFSQNGTSARGLGDIEWGVKYRFLAQTKSRPEIGTFPQMELPTGDASRGLGNGQTWFKVPIWLQKDLGPWTTYGGGGYAINTAPGQHSYGFGGLLIQRSLSSRLTLGGEIFFQGAQVSSPGRAGARSSSLWNFGGSYNFTPDFSLLFTAGHSFQGDGNSLLYLGLYRTWGPGAT